MEKLLSIISTQIAAVAISGPASAQAPNGAAPTNVTASPWPYTALISFTAPTPPAGLKITSYTAVGVNAAWLRGTAWVSPIMIQGGNPGFSNATFTVAATYSDGTTGPASAPSNAVATSAGTVNSTSPRVYANGEFYWTGDYSFGASVAYTDTTGNPSAQYDVKFCTPSQGGWQPYAPNATYDLTPYRFMYIDLKPTVAGKTWDLQFVKIRDVPVGVTILIDATGTYGPAPRAGVWATYKIPLSALGVGPGLVSPIFKFTLHDHANVGANCWYAQNIYFSAN
ncbi:MAG: hypothetical protein ACLPV8_21820 [Steroidobacteraceae bacterium]